MPKPTYQDATLMIQIAQWGSMSGTNEAANWIWSDEYIPDYKKFIKKHPPGSEGFGNASKVCQWFETIGTLYKQGLINKALVDDWMTADLVWERIKGFALGQRERSGEPRIYENFEAMAKAQKGK